MFMQFQIQINRFFKANDPIFPENRCLTFSRKFACIMMHGRMTVMRIRFYHWYTKLSMMLSQTTPFPETATA